MRVEFFSDEDVARAISADAIARGVHSGDEALLSDAQRAAVAVLDSDDVARRTVVLHVIPFCTLHGRRSPLAAAQR